MAFDPLKRPSMEQMKSNVAAAGQKFSPKTPTTNSAYTQGIRSGLVGKGIADSDIGYNPMTKAVTVKGKDFMNPSRLYGGSSYTSPERFNQAWDTYNRTNTQNAQTGNTGSTGYGAGMGVGSNAYANGNYNPYASAGAGNPYNQDINNTLKTLSNMASQTGNVDPYSSAEYNAFQAQSNRRANEGIRSAQEAFGGAGFGRSYALGERAQGIQNKEAEYLETQVIPQILQSQREQQQMKFNNTMQSLNPLLGQQQRGDQLVQQDFTNNLAVTDRTGNYLPQGAQQVLNDLMNLKRQAETKGLANTEVKALSAQADQLRNVLQGMGIDITRLGANVNSNVAAQAGLGQRTLAGQATDLARKNANLDASLALGDRSGMVLDPVNDWGLLYDQVKAGGQPLNLQGQQLANSEDQRAIENDRAERTLAIQQAYQSGQLTIDQARLALQQLQQQDDSAYKWAGLDYEMAQQAQVGSKYEGMSAKDVIANVRKNFQDQDGVLPKDMDTKRKMYWQIVGSNLPDADENQALLNVGLTKEDIAAIDAENDKKLGK